MFVEDLIALAADQVSPRTHDGKFITSLASRVMRHEALTTRQGFAFLSLLRRDRTIRESVKGSEVVLANPQWRLPLVESKVIHHEVRYLGDNFLGFRTNRSRATGPDLALMEAVWAQGMHIVQVNTVRRLNEVVGFIGKYDFPITPDVESYLASALDSGELSTHAVLAEDTIVIDSPNDEALSCFVLHVAGGEPL